MGLILLLLILTGCTGEMSRTEKNICYAMATKSYAYIPLCETEKSCFEKVDALFKTNLGYSQEGKLYEFKNRVARSWFFYNKATLEAKTLAQYCQAGNYGALAGSINQIRNYIDNSFLELDQGMKLSFAIVDAEEKYLTEQKLDLAKEEPEYESLVELRQILSELKSGATNSDSYVSYYLNRAESYAKSTASKAQPQLVEKTPFLVETVEYLQAGVLPELNLGGTKEFIFLTDSFRKTMDYFERTFYTKQALTAVQNLPISEYMKLYSDLGGSENSSLKRFADLMNRVSKNKNQTSKNLDGVWEEIGDKTALCKTLLERISKNINYDYVASELDFSEVKSEIPPSDFFAETLGKIILLKEEKVKGNLSRGEELLKTKEVLNELAKIEEMLKTKEELTTQKLGQHCDNASKEFKEINYSSENNSIKKLISDTDYFASKVLSSKNEEKINYCADFLKVRAQLDLAFKEYSILEAQKKDSAKDCFEYVSDIINKIELNEIKLLFEELKNEEVTKDNLFQFEENCLLLKEQINNTLWDNATTKETLAKFNELKENIKQIESIEPYAENNFKDKLNYFKSKLSSYSKYFNENEPNYTQLLPVQEILNESISTTNREAKEYLEEAIIEYARAHTKIIMLNDAAVETGKEYKLNAKLIVPNPAHKINKEFNFAINTNLFSLLQKDECIQNIQKIDENTINIQFSCLNFGSTTADYLTAVKILILEKDEIIFASNEESLLRRTLTFNTNGAFQKCLIKTKAPINSEKNSVLINDTEIGGYKDMEGNLSVLIESCSQETRLSIIFYISELIKTSIRLVGNESYFGKEQLEYDFVAKSTSVNPLNATLILKIPNNKFVEKVEVFDEEYIQKKHEFVGEKIVLKNQTFIPLEEKKYLLRVTVNSSFDYYFEEIKKQADELFLLGDEENSTRAKQVLLRGVANSFEGLIKEFEKNSKLIAELKKQNEAKVVSDQLKNKLLENVELLRANQKELLSLGLEKQAKEVDALLSKVLSLNLDNYSEVVKAFDLISKNSFSAEEGIKEKLAEFAQNISKMRQDTNNFVFLEKAEAFLLKKQTIEGLISSDPANAKIKFASLEEDFTNLVKLKEEMDTNLAKTEKENQKSVKVLYEECKTLLNYLFENLGPLESQLIKLKIIPPITQSRTSKLELMLEEVINSKQDTQEKLNKMEEIKLELTRAIDFLKRQAVTAFNRGIDSSASTTLLSNAKELIDSNKYADALILFQSNGLEGGIFQSNNLLFFIPILLITGLAFVLKHQFGKKVKENEEKKKFISETWKE